MVEDVPVPVIHYGASDTQVVGSMQDFNLFEILLSSCSRAT
jgi:hypothetical protein